MLSLSKSGDDKKPDVFLNYYLSKQGNFWVVRGLVSLVWIGLDFIVFVFVVLTVLLVVAFLVVYFYLATELNPWSLILLGSFRHTF